MTDGCPPPCPGAQNAAGYVLGTLTNEEHAAFEAHLQAGCEACQTELTEAQATVAEMDLARFGQAEVDTPKSLKERLIQRIGIPESHAEEATARRREWQHWKADEASEELAIVRSASGGFRPTEFEGIEVRPLSVDADRDTVTMLIRMAPGSSYPEHKHAAREECFVLSGDLQVGGEDMLEGDYQVAPEGSLHPVQSTRGGCTLLIVSSQHDEMV